MDLCWGFPQQVGVPVCFRVKVHLRHLITDRAVFIPPIFFCLSEKHTHMQRVICGNRSVTFHLRAVGDQATVTTPLRPPAFYLPSTKIGLQWCPNCGPWAI